MESVRNYEVARAPPILTPIDAIPKRNARQKNAGVKNKNRRWRIFIFHSGIFLSGLFWEKVIPKADRSPDALIVILISNHVIAELTPWPVSGTPLGYLIGIITENRHNRSVAAMTAQLVWRLRYLPEVRRKKTYDQSLA
jgi:hypothetical protein